MKGGRVPIIKWRNAAINLTDLSHAFISDDEDNPGKYQVNVFLVSASECALVEDDLTMDEAEEAIDEIITAASFELIPES